MKLEKQELPLLSSLALFLTQLFFLVGQELICKRYRLGSYFHSQSGPSQKLLHSWLGLHKLLRSLISSINFSLLCSL